MKTFYQWLNEETEDYGLCDPPMSDALAMDFLTDYLLGRDWYTVMPESHDQINTIKVFSILYRYSKEFKKEFKRENKKFRTPEKKSKFKK